MVALLVALSVMSIMLATAMPVWRQASTREKEAELVFRGKQYARAIELFQRKTPGALPPNLDILVTQRYLRKKYKDPITGDDFLLVRQGEGTSGAQQASTSRGATGRQAGPPQSGRGAAAQPGGVVGGIMGVASKSTAASLLIYNGRTKYNEWQFVYVAQTQAPGAGGGPGTPAPGQRGRGGTQQPVQGGSGAVPYGPRGPLQPPGGRGAETPGGRQSRRP